MKTMSIIGIVLSTVFFLWFLLFLASNGISKQEFSLVGVAFCLWSIAFSVVAIVVSFRKKNIH